MSWGPVLWSILHTSAEHLGKPRPPLLETDEVNRWMFLLKSVEGVMPCNLCRKHYDEWLKKHPVAQFTALRGTALREHARQWLYSLHENVNIGKNIQSGIKIDDIPSMYSTLTRYHTDIDRFIELTRENVQNGLLKAEATRVFRSHLQYLRKISDTI